LNTQIKATRPLVLKAPAKVNLLLKVLGRRDDGYHELLSIMVPISLCDTIQVFPFRRTISLECHGARIPADSSNLVWQAVEAFFSEAGIQSGTHIKLKKNIPVAAGLGGGSSDAASVLIALNAIYNKPLGGDRLHGVARKLGADVPFFLYRVPSVARGIGDILEPIKNWPQFWYVIAVPSLEISTAWVYDRFKLELTQAPSNYIVKSDNMAGHQVAQLLENDLERVVIPRWPQVAELKELLVDLGALGAVMSGSGPSVVGIFEQRQKAARAAEVVAETRTDKVFLATLWRNKEGAIGLGG